MDPIRMVDLKKQYDFLEEEVALAMREVLDSTAFINGPMVQAFQKDLEQYLNAR